MKPVPLDIAAYSTSEHVFQVLGLGNVPDYTSIQTQVDFSIVRICFWYLHYYDVQRSLRK